MFSRYFIDQVEMALREKNAERKKKIILDIEDAVTRVVTVYKNLVDNTANADKQIFTSFGFDTNVYELSPKLTAFYSDILEKVTEMFDPSGQNYAFLLYPNLKHNTEAYHLFRERVGGGRITSIYIPECKMELVDIIPIFLLHEAFHVLTDSERNRRQRAGKSLILMTVTLIQRLHQDLELEDECWNKLIDVWFKEVVDAMDSYRNKSSDSMDFYGKNILESQNSLFKQIIYNLDRNAEKDILEICYSFLRKTDGDTFSNFMGIYIS